MRWRYILYIVGALIFFVGLSMLLPLAFGLYYRDHSVAVLLKSIGVTVSTGALLFIAFRSQREDTLRQSEGMAIVALGWTAAGLFGALPFYLEGGTVRFVDAFFESVSGFTTTGASILTDIEALPKGLLMWRSFIQWLGGMGIIVLAVAILPLLGVGGRQLFKAETPGPMKDTALTPRITETARNLWLIYLGITIACILSLKIAGMNWLDAVCHAFSTMSTGGFSTHDASIGYYNSPSLELILIVFMLLAAMNFATHFLAWRSKSLRLYLRDSEAVSMIGLTLASCVGIALFLWWRNVYPSFWIALRHASFNLVSMATDSGFASVDFGQWPIFAPLWMLFLSCITASSGSTGGGIKMIRTLILFKQAGREFIKLLHPAAINPMKIGGSVVPNNIVFAVLGFIFLYFMTVATLTFALLGSDMDFVSSFSAVIACINNAGPGLGQVGPAGNYAGLTAFQDWVCILGMLAGRLEIFTVLILFTPQFWRR